MALARLLHSCCLRSVIPPSICLVPSRAVSSKSNKSAKRRDSAVKRSDDDITQNKVTIKGKNCWTPKEAKTNLINFIMRSDMEKRSKNINIPFFTSGCYMRVTYADPGARHGRNQFTGICIARSNKGLGSTFTLRNVIQRVGVERMFELYSPHLIEIQVLKLERRNKAKLYYLRNLPPKFSTVNEKMAPVDTGGKLVIYKRHSKK